MSSETQTIDTTADNETRTSDQTMATGRELRIYKLKRQLRRHTSNLLTTIGLAIVVFPMFWMVSSAVRPEAAMFTRPASLLPPEFTLVHFEKVLFQSDFTTYFINSTIVALGVVLLTTVSATLGGYGLARINIPKKQTFARMILFGYMFPAILLAIPMFIFWNELGIINSYIGLILAETGVALPFSLWMMWKFFQTVPESLEEAAQMAGATRFRAFYEIALPVAKPGIVAIAIFSFAGSWNAYTFPKIIMVDTQMWPLTIGLYSFTVQESILWGQLMAASVLTLLPPFLFIFVLQKYLITGFSTGGW